MASLDDGGGACACDCGANYDRLGWSCSMWKCVRLPGRVIVDWLGEASGGAETKAGVLRVAADFVLLTQIGGRGSA